MQPCFDTNGVWPENPTANVSRSLLWVSDSGGSGGDCNSIRNDIT